MDLDVRAVVTLTKAEAQTSHVSLKAGKISTVRLESLATLADGSLNKWITGDAAVLSEVVINVIAKPVTDGVSINELYTPHLTKPAPDETFNIADTFVKVVTWDRFLTDAFTLDDAAQIDKQYFGNKGNIFNILEELSISIGRELTDSYTVGEVIAIAMAYDRAHTELSLIHI